MHYMIMNSKHLYYLSFAISSSIFSYAAYNIIKFFLFKEKENEDSVLDVSLEITNNKLTPELSVQITSYINRLFHKKEKANMAELNTDRRESIEDSMTYRDLTKETIRQRDIYYKESVERILKVIENKFTYNEIQNELSKLSMDQLEKMFFMYDKPDIEASPSKDVVKEAYLFYSKELVKEFRKVKQAIVNINNHKLDEKETKMLIQFEIELGFQKADDLLYNKNNLSEREITYLIMKYNLINEDEEVKEARHSIFDINERYTE